MTDHADAAAVGHGSGILAGLGQRGRAVASAITAQSNRAIPWLVAFFAAGIVLFFAWDFDPPAWLGAIASVVSVVLTFVLRRHMALRFALAAIAAFALGHGVAQLRTVMVAAPLLREEMGPLQLSARVVDAEKRPEGHHLVVAGFQLPDMAPSQTPSKLRITVPAAHALPGVGERISVRVILRPPPRPVVPGGFQFQRQLFFQGIGGTGFSVGRWRAESESPPDDLPARIHRRIENLRRAVGDRVMEIVPGDHGAVAAALINGEQSAIPEDLQEAYRVSGLAHLLSISGVHLSLLAGIIFLVVRRGLALFPTISLNVDTKKIAAWSGLTATEFYTLISGMSVPAIRSFIMIAIIFVAILLDRTALSLRSISWAALVLMIFVPEAVAGASFQMSFLAVLSLIALYEAAGTHLRWRTDAGGFRIGRAVLVYIAAMVATDLVAGTSTSLFAAYHFNRYATYSLLANLLAVPIMGLWIMPFGIIGLILMPFGLDHPAITAMGAGVNMTDTLAHWVASLPGAQLHVPPINAAAIALAAASAIFICLWQGRWRWVGLLPIVIALGSAWAFPPPDFLADESGRVIAVSDPRGIVARPSRAGQFVKEVWADRYGASDTTWPVAGKADAALGLACDGQGCLLERKGRKILLALSSDAIAQDCANVALIVTPLVGRDLCDRPTIIDRFDLAEKGAHAIWLEQGGAHITTVADIISRRVWNAAAAPESDDDGS